MPLPCPGPAPISLLDIQTEFGGPSSGIGISSYYRNGSIITQKWYVTTIPTSGVISFNNFFCTQKSNFWMVMYYDINNSPITIRFTLNGTKLYIISWEGDSSTKRNLGLFSLNISSNTSPPILESLSQLSDNSTAGNSLFSSAIGLSKTNGNMYIGGYRRSTPSFFDGGSYIGAIITKYDSNKSIQWQKIINPDSTTRSTSVAVNNSEEIYVSGEADLSGIFLNKYNSSGGKIWGKALYPSIGGNSAINSIIDIALDSSQNMYLGGTQYTPANPEFPNGTLIQRSLLVKYDPDGVLLWKKTFNTVFNSTNELALYALGIDLNDNVYTISYYADSIYSQRGLYIRKCNTSGSVIWQRTYTFGDPTGAKLAFDSSGNIYVCLYDSLVSPSSTIILKFSDLGVLLWQRRLYSCLPKDIAVGTNNELYVLASTFQYGLVIKIPQDGGPTNLNTYNSPFPAFGPASKVIFSSTSVASNAEATDQSNDLPEQFTAFTSTTKTYAYNLFTQL